MDGICQYDLLPVQPCNARRSGHVLDLASTLDPNGQLNCGTFSGQSLYVQPVEPAGKGPLGILQVGSSYTEHPSSV